MDLTQQWFNLYKSCFSFHLRSWTPGRMFPRRKKKKNLRHTGSDAFYGFSCSTTGLFGTAVNKIGSHSSDRHHAWRKKMPVPRQSKEQTWYGVPQKYQQSTWRFYSKSCPSAFRILSTFDSYPTSTQVDTNTLYWTKSFGLVIIGVCWLPPTDVLVFPHLSSECFWLLKSCNIWESLNSLKGRHTHVHRTELLFC